MKRTLLPSAVFVALSAAAATSSCSGGGSMSRDGAGDQTNVDSSAAAPTSADVGEESRNVDFRSSTSALPDSLHPGATTNANGQMLEEPRGN